MRKDFIMEQTFHIVQIGVGFHPDGYRIDKISSPIGPYTKWEISSGGQWCNPEPVHIEELPLNGWFKVDKFNWNGVERPIDITAPYLLNLNI